MDKFEYKILDVNRTQIKQNGFQVELMGNLNKLGAEGWELITIEGMNEGSVFFRVSETVDILFVFKRKING
jgi:hypothetical protein